jgi:hypothetical protein
MACVHVLAAGTAAMANLAHLAAVLQEAGLTFEPWTGTPYSSDAHLKVRGCSPQQRLSCLPCLAHGE